MLTSLCLNFTYLATETNEINHFTLQLHGMLILDGVFVLSRGEWALRFQGMVVLAGSQVWWTWEVEDAFRRLGTKTEKAALKALARQQRSQVEEIVSRIRGDLPANDRTKLTTLLTIDVHSRDVVDGFVRDNIADVSFLDGNQAS